MMAAKVAAKDRPPPIAQGEADKVGYGSDVDTTRSVAPLPKTGGALYLSQNGYGFKRAVLFHGLSSFQFISLCLVSLANRIDAS
jgi:hypothetical protein